MENNIKRYVNIRLFTERRPLNSSRVSKCGECVYVCVNESSSLNTKFSSQKSRAPTNGTPRSSHRSITSDYESSSILDSASMYGTDEPSTSSPSIHSQNQPSTQHREVNIDEHISSKSKKKSKDPAPILTVNKSSDSPAKSIEVASKSDAMFGLSTIKEGFDAEENQSSSRQHTDDEIDFDGCFNKIQQKKNKKPAPTVPQGKEQQKSVGNSQSEDIRTPSASISTTVNTQHTSSTLAKRSDDLHESTDDDVDELLGNLEVRLPGKYIHTYTYTHTHIYTYSLCTIFD